MTLPMACASFFLAFALSPISALADEPSVTRLFYNSFSDEEAMTTDPNAAAETEEQMMLSNTILQKFVRRVGQGPVREALTLPVVLLAAGTPFLLQTHPGSADQC